MKALIFLGIAAVKLLIAKLLVLVVSVLVLLLGGTSRPRPAAASKAAVAWALGESRRGSARDCRQGQGQACGHRLKYRGLPQTGKNDDQ